MIEKISRRFTLRLQLNAYNFITFFYIFTCLHQVVQLTVSNKFAKSKK